MQLGDLSVEFAGHDALTELFDAVHLGLCKGSPVVVAPPFPHRPTEALAGSQSLVPDDGSWGVRLPRAGIFARRDHCIGTSPGDGVVAFKGVVSAICRDRSNVLFVRNLSQQFGEHRGVANACTRYLDGLNLQRLRVDGEMELHLAAALGRAMLGKAMLAGVPLTVPFDLDAGTID